MEHLRSDYDGPWKKILDRYFKDFMASLEIDWTKGYAFLDKELQRVIRNAEIGRRLVDKLIKVWKKDGSEAWVLIHIEIQGHKYPEFARRMYEEEKKMRYITSIERIGIQKGIHQTIRKLLLNGLAPDEIVKLLDISVEELGMLANAREMVAEVISTGFSRISEKIVKAISTIEDRNILKELLKKTVLTRSLEQFESEFQGYANLLNIDMQT